MSSELKQRLIEDHSKEADKNDPFGGEYHLYGHVHSPEQHSARPHSKHDKKEGAAWPAAAGGSKNRSGSREKSKRKDSIPGSREDLSDSIQIDGWSIGLSPRNSRCPSINSDIDGRFSISETQTSEFVRVEIDTTFTSQELKKCKKTVLRPYLIFLKVIGWRRFWESEQDLRQHRFYAFLNVIYPAFIFLMLTATTVIQQLTCFYRTLPANFRSISDSFNSTHLINCSDHIVVNQVVAGMLIPCAYLYGIYLFRYAEPEHLSALIERVFLSYSQEMSGKKRKIIWVLRSYLVLGSLWILLDFTLNIVRIISLQLLDPNSPNFFLSQSLNSTTNEYAVRCTFVIFLLFGFAVHDVLYFAVVVAYASQSQLILYYITSIIEKVRNKVYSLEDAVKDIRQTYTYLEVLNSKLSTLTSFTVFLFLLQVLLSIHDLADIPEVKFFIKEELHIFYVGVIVVGLGSILQWSILAGVPLIQAGRLTAYCRQLRRLGLEIASRPFVYADTPQLDLIYFLQYTNASRYTAKLAAVPVYPWMVVGSLFLGGIIGCYVIKSDNHFMFAPWF